MSSKVSRGKPPDLEKSTDVKVLILFQVWVGDNMLLWFIAVICTDEKKKRARKDRM